MYWKFFVSAYIFLQLALPVLAGELNILGIKAFRSGDYVKAEQLYRQALLEDASRIEKASVYRNLAVLYQAQSKDASEFIKKADELDPPSVHSAALESAKKKIEENTAIVPSSNAELLQAAAKGTSVMLSGKIEHSDHLPATLPDFRKGSLVNMKKLKMLTANNVWERIPRSLAGTWHCEEQTNLCSRTLKTMKVHGKEVIHGGDKTTKPEIQKYTTPKETVNGFQIDKNGDVWTYKGGDLKVSGDFGEVYTIDTVTNVDSLSRSDKRSLSRAIGPRLIVEKRTNQILASIQCEAISTISLVEDGLIRSDQSLQTFDEDGSPIQVSENTSLKHRVSKFKVIDSYQGKDMHALFREYMITHGYKDLLP